MMQKFLKRFFNKKAEGSVSTGIKVLTAIVVGALLLTGLYGVTSGVVLPNTSEKIESLFNYSVAADGSDGDGGFGGGTGTPEVVPTVEELQETYTFAYYSDMVTPVNDINTPDDGITANANSNKDEAVSGVYVDESGVPNVVLLKDFTTASALKPNADMVINLGGNTLSGGLVIDSLGGAVVVDGRLDGSCIEATNKNMCQFRAGKVDVLGGTYVVNANKSNVTGIMSQADLTVKNINLSVNNAGGTSTGIQVNKNSSMSISNSNIDVLGAATTDAYSFGINALAGSTATVDNIKVNVLAPFSVAGIRAQEGGTIATVDNSEIYVESTSNEYVADSAGYSTAGVLNGANMTVTNTKVKADGAYYLDSNDEKWTSCPRGVYTTSESVTNLKNCNVTGVHSGVQSYGAINIDGGVYESYGHGGFYICAENTTSYIKNATIRECAASGSYIIDGGTNEAGFYIGGGTTYNNIVVYMDNCDIQGSKTPFVLRYTSADPGNSLYISNSRINKNYQYGVRLDKVNSKIYLGSGNNFDVNDAWLNYITAEDAAARFVTTNEVYCQD